MENGVDRSASPGVGPSRAWARDALGAIALAEGAIAQRIFVVGDAKLDVAEHNAFKLPVAVVRGTDAAAMLDAYKTALGAGERVALVATAAALGRAREALRAIGAQRLGGVVHVLAERANADAMGLADLGWGLLFAAGAFESLDLTMIARRAAEDSGAPFFVVHTRPHAGARHLEPVAPPSVELCEVFVGAPQMRVKRVGDPAHPVHADVSERAFAERVPFALGSAMRELESLTGRRHDVLERIPAGEVQVVLVALGEIGASLLSAVERLRMAGHDVGAVKLTALRPFPGARLVKVLSRALAVSVIESVDEPLAQSNPLTREIKASFADALTWAPDYPGIGRIPRVLSGIAELGGHELDAKDIDAIVHNMLADERGKRSFVLGGDEALALPAAPAPAASLPAKTVAREAPPAAFSMRGRVKDLATAEACAELVSSVLVSALGLRARATARPLPAAEGDGFAFDIHASRERPRGSHAPHAVHVVALDEASALIRGNVLLRLSDGGVLVVPTEQRTADGVWNEVPPYVKAIVHDRGARLVGWSTASITTDAAFDARRAPWLTAAGFAGIALAFASSKPGGRPGIDPSLVAREVKDGLLLALGSGEEAIARRGGEHARQTFAASVEVPRATVERDEEAVRLGRRDARARVT